MKTGGQLVVEALVANGVKRISCVPGESYLAVLDALYDTDIDVVVCRQEGGAAMMADTWGRLTGEPGICMVTRGPGATNASAGLHVARQDSIPMILFIGQVQRDAREREAFQEIEYRRALTEVAKWVGEIDDPARIPEFVTRAFAVATSGRPGPVVLTLPEDMLTESAEAPAARAYQPVESHPGPAQMARLATLLADAKRPIAVLGGTRWSAESVAEFQRFAERWQLPVGCSFRRQMLFDHLNPMYAGDVGIGINPALAKEIKEADLILLLGGRLSEMPSLLLHARRRALSEADAGACPSRSVRTRSCLSAGSRDRREPARFRRFAGRRETSRHAGLGAAHRHHARDLSQMVDAAGNGTR
ncbi:thiamine pyrophosphate-dependent acetolactate synthase large subunit-like protein [Sinorhizobium fredii]